MTVFLQDQDATLYHGDCLDVLRTLPDGAADACVTSPPYLDARPEYPSPTFDEFADIFAELRRVVSGALLLNVGRLHRGGEERLWWVDSIDVAAVTPSGLHGWPLRDTLVWVKPNGNPIKGPVVADSHEYVFLFGDGFDPDAVRTPYQPATLARYRRGFAANAGVKGLDRPLHRRHRPLAADEAGARPRSYLEMGVGREKGNPHPAPMPQELARHLVLLSGGATILDPFAGSGTTLLAARALGRRSIGIELNADYCALAASRLAQQSLLTGAA